MVRDKQMRCENVVRAHLARMDAVRVPLNAIVFRDDERALARAAEADRALAKGEIWGPLHGVPVTIKDSFHFVKIWCWPS